MKLPWWVAWILRTALKWLVKNALKKLSEGIWIKLEIKEDVLHIYIKLEDNPPAFVDYLNL